MHVISQWAILSILFTCIVANSVRNVSETAVGVKITRSTYSSLSGYEKCIQQRRDNVTETPTAKQRPGAASSTYIIDDAVRQLQHPVKKQIKFKRHRYVTNDFNGTKSLTYDKLKPARRVNELKTDAKVTSPFSTFSRFPNETIGESGSSSSNSNVDTGNSISRIENFRTPSHRKKRRRIATSISATNSTTKLEWTNGSSHDGLSQYLNFGRKILVSTTPRRNVLVAAPADAARSFHEPLVYRSMTSTPPKTGTAEATICLTNYRIIRSSGMANSTREFILNNATSCRPNVVRDKKDGGGGGGATAAAAASTRNKTDNEVAGTEIRSSMEPPQSPATSDGLEQFTTKILSTAIVKSVSVKNTEKQKSPPPPPPPSTTINPFEIRSIRKLKDTMRKPSADLRLYDLFNSSSSIHVSTAKSISLPYFRANYTHRSLNRNPDFSKFIYPPINKFTLAAATESIKTSINNNIYPETNLEYLTNTAIKQDSETVILELTTWRSNATSADEKIEQVPSSSVPPLFEMHDETDNERYAISNNSQKLHPINPTVFTIFARNHSWNHGAEQTFKPAPNFQDTEHFDRDDANQSGFHLVTYVLAGLGVIPLVIGIVLAMRIIVHQNKKQIFEGSEYSSEYNRNPLEFNAGVTSSPVATKLPRVHQQTHWEIERKFTPSISLPVNSHWEFPRSKLRLQTLLGQGNFGQVWKAEADDISGHEGLTRLVAVKMVKEISSSREKEDLIKELMIMQHLGSHPNVVMLLGCCTEKEPYMLIMEYVMYGKLLSFLRDHRTRTHYFNFSDNGDTLTSRDLTVFAYFVARGMEYLQSKKVIHRDLAARNILIDHNKLCKIADFGMSRYVDDSGQMYEHRQSKGALPIRWMAPESLHYSCYTYKTDVWSFGILMWEIITLGSMPYASMGARIVMRKVKEGYRLEKPKHCKPTLFNIISKCWHSDPSKRPSFTDLKQDLLNLLENAEHEGNYVELDALVEEINQTVQESHNEKFII